MATHNQKIEGAICQATHLAGDGHQFHQALWPPDRNGLPNSARQQGWHFSAWLWRHKETGDGRGAEPLILN
jgi:hypothetical protein